MPLTTVATIVLLAGTVWTSWAIGPVWAALPLVLTIWLIAQAVRADEKSRKLRKIISISVIALAALAVLVCLAWLTIWTNWSF